MVINVLNQLQRRTLRGTRIKNFIITREVCSRLEYAEHHCVEICYIIYFKSEGEHIHLHECEVINDTYFDSEKLYIHSNECNMKNHNLYYNYIEDIVM